MRRIKDSLLRTMTWVFAALTLGIVMILIGYILLKGVPHLRFSLFALTHNTQNASLFPAMITTVMMVALSLSIAVPIGIFAAVFLVEYAGDGNRFVPLVRVMAETLSGIPSIIYGLFGSLFFVIWLGWGLSVLAGSCTLSIMMLPLIIRTSEESLKSVPNSYREGAFALGTGKLRTVFYIVLPSAAPGLFAGIVLAIGRIVGETAALIYTAGTVAKIPENIFASGRTLAIHMYALSSEGLYTNQAHATAVILLCLVIGINALSGYIMKKITKGDVDG